MPQRSYCRDRDRPQRQAGALAAVDLDAEYSPSRCVPDYRSILSRYRRLSDAAKNALPCELGVQYGEADREVLHHFPPRRGGSPLLVYVHGGHWQELSVDDSCFAASRLVEQGAGFVALGYPLAPEATLDAMVASIARALEWATLNASALGTTPQTLYAAGSSAGAHLLAMALATRAEAGAPALAGVTLLSGVYDLSLIRLSYVNAALGLTDADARRNSPIHFLPLRAGEVLVARGETETDEYRRQHHLMVSALRLAAGCEGLRSQVCPNRNHFDLPLGLGDPHDRLGRAVLEQMRLGVAA